MGDSHALETFSLAQPAEPSVAKLPGGHLYAERAGGGIAFSVEGFDKAAHPVIITPGTHQSLVGIAFLSTKGEIAMRHGKWPPAAQDQVRQAHRIRPAAHRNKHCSPAGREQFLKDIFKELLHNYLEAIV